MENKYYTPELEEFHIGFEYEWMREGERATPWTKSSLTFNNGPIGDEDAWRNNDYRVKYLDKEDIESLGWKANNKYGDFYIESDKESGYTLSFYEKKILIQDTGEGIFYGVIKNKSELKKLMKQLNIE